MEVEYYDRVAKNCHQFRLLFPLSFIRSFGWREGDVVKGVEKGIVILARYKFHFIREHENLM